LVDCDQTKQAVIFVKAHNLAGRYWVGALNKETLLNI